MTPWSGAKLHADHDLLFFLVLSQKLGDPSCRPLHKPQFLMQDVVHGVIRHPMGSRLINSGHTTVGLLFGDNVQGPLDQ